MDLSFLAMTELSMADTTDFNFHVKKIEIGYWVLYIVVFIALYSWAIVGYSEYGVFIEEILLSIAAILFLPMIWKLITASNSFSLLCYSIQLSHAKRNWLDKFFYKIMGLYLDDKSDNFISSSGGKLNLNQPVKIFKNKIIKTVGVVAGLNFITLRLIMTFMNSELSNLILWSSVNVTSVFSAIISSFLVILFFILEDIGIFSLEDDLSIGSMKANIEDGFLSKIIGIAGLLLIFDFSFSFYVDQGEDLIFAYIFGFLDSLELYSYQLLIPFWTTLIYFNFFHENIINRARIALTEILPVKHLILRSIGVNSLEKTITVQDVANLPTHQNPSPEINPEKSTKILQGYQEFKKISKENDRITKIFFDSLISDSKTIRFKKWGLIIIRLILLALSIFLIYMYMCII